VKQRYDPERHHRRSMRLRGYDYSRAATYFVTICTYQRECLLGEVVDGRVLLGALGRLVEEQWHAIPGHFDSVSVDAFVAMPNHVHGLIVIGRGGVTPPLRKPTLGRIVAYYKYQTTKAVNLFLDASGNRLWQRNYHDRIVRNKRELRAIRQYIRQNPAHWPDDPENPSQLVQG